MTKEKAKLEKWKERLSSSNASYEKELGNMSHREDIYNGHRRLKPGCEGDRTTETVHVRNIVMELIESEISSEIPSPKVTARRKKDEHLAKVIENMIRNELDRLPMEEINDIAERTCCIQGGVGFLLEWDNTRRTHTTVGELSLSVLHPSQIIPQDGVYSSVEDMDYIILKVPETKEYIRRRYDVDVADESESEPTVKGYDSGLSRELVTMYVAYYRNDSGGIGKFSWVNDTVLEDMEDYQARKLRRCGVCGAAEPGPDVVNMEGGREKNVCPYCGGAKWERSDEEYETIYSPIMLSGGGVIDPVTGYEETQSVDGKGKAMVDDFGLPVMETAPIHTKIPYYKPDIYPVILQRNVSKHGKFLGGSDVDAIEDQYNTGNRLESKILDKLLKSGSYMTLPTTASIRADSTDMKVIRLSNAADKAMIDVFDMQGNVQQDIAYLQQVYTEARQTIGITDSYQGRADPTATSGRAKEFAAAQSAGRFESKRTMKNFAYSRLFEAMFKFKLAYCDEPVPVVSKDIHGEAVYGEFNRYDFLERDEAGEWYWNDQFLFSVDSGAVLAGNREAMWQETLNNFRMGTFGDPRSIDTLIFYWTKMSMLHYPGSQDTLESLREQKRQQMRSRGMQRQTPAAIQAAPAAGNEMTATATGGADTQTPAL